MTVIYSERDAEIRKERLRILATARDELKVLGQELGREAVSPENSVGLTAFSLGRAAQQARAADKAIFDFLNVLASYLHDKDAGNALESPD